MNNLVEVQKEKLKALLVSSAISRGVTLNPFDIEAFLKEFYSFSFRQAGTPTTIPALQQPRAQFSVESYNTFLETTQFDYDTLLSFFKRARLDARTQLVLNDVLMRRFMERLDILDGDTEIFNNIPTEETIQEIKSTTLKYPLRQAKAFYPDSTSPLNLDAINGSIGLPLLSFLSKGIDLSFLESNSPSINALVDYANIVENVELSPFSNIINTDASPWVQNLTLNGDFNTASLQVVIEFPTIEQINRIAFKPLPGVAISILTEIASIGDNYITIRTLQNLQQPGVINFSPVKVKKIRFTFTANVQEINNAKSSFLFGLTSLQINRDVYKDKGSILLKDIDPKIGDRPILSVNMKVKAEFPENISANYFISLNNQFQFIPNTKINGSTSDDSFINFSIAQTIEDPIASISREFFRRKNGVNINFLNFTSLAPFLTDQDKTYIPRISELWTGQNSFIERDFPDAVNRKVTDAIVNFKNDNQFSEVLIPLEQEMLPVNKDVTETYIQLNLHLSKLITTSSTITPNTDVFALMKTEDVGLFKVTTYKSNNKENPTVINNLAYFKINYPDRVYITGTYQFNDSFSVSYLGRLDETVLIKRGTPVLHSSTGRSGQEESDKIPLSSGRWQINFDTNQVFSTTNSGLNNTKKYLDFEGLFDFTQLKVYEAYIQVPAFTGTINLDRTLKVDREIGEYISLRGLTTESSTRLEGASVINGLNAGWYLLTVLSKPYSNQPSAIKTLFQVKDQPGLPSELPKKVFDLKESRYFSRVGTTNEPLTYVEKVKLLNETKRIGSTEFSSTIDGNMLRFIVPESGYNVLPVDIDDGGVERASMILNFFPTNLFKDNVHNRLNLKIDMFDKSNPGTTLSTGDISAIDFTFKYL